MRFFHNTNVQLLIMAIAFVFAFTMALGFVDVLGIMFFPLLYVSIVNAKSPKMRRFVSLVVWMYVLGGLIGMGIILFAQNGVFDHLPHLHEFLLEKLK